MLLDGLDDDENQSNNIFDPKDFVDIKTGRNIDGFGIGTDPYQTSKRKETNKTKE
jgi:hypothetical protein